MNYVLNYKLKKMKKEDLSKLVFDELRALDHKAFLNPTFKVIVNDRDFYLNFINLQKIDKSPAICQKFKELNNNLNKVLFVRSLQSLQKMTKSELIKIYNNIEIADRAVDSFILNCYLVDNTLCEDDEMRSAFLKED